MTSPPVFQAEASLHIHMLPEATSCHVEAPTCTHHHVMGSDPVFSSSISVSLLSISGMIDESFWRLEFDDSFVEKSAGTKAGIKDWVKMKFSVIFWGRSARWTMK